MKTTLTILLIITMLVDAGMTTYALSRPDRRSSVPFATLTIFLFLYSFGYLLEVQSTTAEAAFVALQVENLAIPFLGFLVFAVVWGYCSARPLKRWFLIVSVLVSMGLFFSVLFNGYHHLYYTNIEMIGYGDSFFAKLNRGPLYVLQQSVTVCYMLASYVVIGRRFLSGGKKIRRQMYMMALGAMTGFTANILNFSGVLPVGLDLTPLALTAGLIFFSIDIFRHKLLEIVHIATSSAVETMEDAFVVLDMDCHVSYCNRSARALFPEMSAFIRMEDIARVSQWPPELSLGWISGGQVVFERTGQGPDSSRAYRANVSKVSNSGGKQMGWSVAVRDITDIMEAERRLTQENAALDRVNRLKTDLMATISHEMRTPLAVMMGFAQKTAPLRFRIVGPFFCSNAVEISRFKQIIPRLVDAKPSKRPIISLASKPFSRRNAHAWGPRFHQVSQPETSISLSLRTTFRQDLLWVHSIRLGHFRQTAGSLLYSR